MNKCFQILISCMFYLTSLDCYSQYVMEKNPAITFDDGTLLPIPFSAPKDPDVCSVFFRNIQYVEKNKYRSYEYTVDPLMARFVKTASWEDIKSDRISQIVQDFYDFLPQALNDRKNIKYKDIDNFAMSYKVLGYSLKYFSIAKSDLLGERESGDVDGNVDFVKFGSPSFLCSDMKYRRDCSRKNVSASEDMKGAKVPDSWKWISVWDNDFSTHHGVAWNYNHISGSQVWIVNGRAYMEYIKPDMDIEISELNLKDRPMANPVCLFKFIK